MVRGVRRQEAARHPPMGGRHMICLASCLVCSLGICAARRDSLACHNATATSLTWRFSRPRRPRNGGHRSVAGEASRRLQPAGTVPRRLPLTPSPPPPPPQERYARKNEDQLLRAAFERLDSNHDGQITADELQAYFEAMGHKAKKVRRRVGRQRRLGRNTLLPTCPLPPFSLAGRGGGHDLGGGRGLRRLGELQGVPGHLAALPRGQGGYVTLG